MGKKLSQMGKKYKVPKVPTSPVKKPSSSKQVQSILASHHNEFVSLLMSADKFVAHDGTQLMLHGILSVHPNVADCFVLLTKPGKPEEDGPVTSYEFSSDDVAAVVTPAPGSVWKYLLAVARDQEERQAKDAENASESVKEYLESFKRAHPELPVVQNRIIVP